MQSFTEIQSCFARITELCRVTVTELWSYRFRVAWFYRVGELDSSMVTGLQSYRAAEFEL